MYRYPTENLLWLKGGGYTAPEELIAAQTCHYLLYLENCMPAAKKPVHSILSLLVLASSVPANLSKVIEGDELVTRRIELQQSGSRAKRYSVQRLNTLRVTHSTAQIK
jgi:hypothetical protein